MHGGVGGRSREASFYPEYSTACKEAICLALVEFARLKPENQLNISDEEKIFTSTGHQFELKALVEFNNKRKPNPDLPEENSTKKWLISPIPIFLGSTIFCPSDVAHIQKVAQERGIPLRYDLVNQQEELAKISRNRFFQVGQDLRSVVNEQLKQSDRQCCNLF